MASGRGGDARTRGLSGHASSAACRAGVGVLVGVTLALPAAAQDAAAPQLEELIVTARKREERLSEVPVSATAMTAERLNAEGISTGVQLFQRVPGVQITNSGNEVNSVIQIRGGGSGRLSDNNTEPATGLYRNGAYLGGGTLGGLTLGPLDYFDVERIEIFRGPQAATFGRNATAGAVNVVSRKPGRDFGGEAQVTYSDPEGASAQAVVNLPLDAAWAVRAGFRYARQWDGFVDNSLTGESLEKSRFAGGRVSLRFEPNDSFDATLTVDHFDQSGPSVGVFAFNSNTTEILDRYHQQTNTPNSFSRYETTAILEAGLDLGFATLRSVTTGRKRSLFNQLDLDEYQDFSQAPAQGYGDRVRQGSGVSFRRFGQEFRLESPAGERLTWVAGVEYLALWETFTINVSGATRPDRTSNLRVRSEDWSAAVFGLVTYAFNERLTGTLEARVNQDNKDIDRRGATFTAAGVSIPNNFVAKAKWTNIAPAAALRYQVNPDVNVYARLAQAYRPGGFNSDLGNPALNLVAFDTAFDPEYVTTGEIGVKAELLDRRLRLEGAVYVTNTKDVLSNFTTNAGAGGRLVRFLDNAGQADQKGVEVDATWLVPLGPSTQLLLTGGLSWQDGEYDAPGLANDGNSLARMPKWIGSLSGMLRHRVSDDLELFANVAYRTRDGGFQGPLNEVNRPLYAFDLFDATIGATLGRTTVSLRAENLFKETYITERTDPAGVQTVLNTPRTWTFTVRQAF